MDEEKIRPKMEKKNSPKRNELTTAHSRASTTSCKKNFQNQGILKMDMFEDSVVVLESETDESSNAASVFNVDMSENSIVVIPNSEADEGLNAEIDNSPILNEKREEQAQVGLINSSSEKGSESDSGCETDDIKIIESDPVIIEIDSNDSDDDIQVLEVNEDEPPTMDPDFFSGKDFIPLDIPLVKEDEPPTMDPDFFSGKDFIPLDIPLDVNATFKRLKRHVYKRRGKRTGVSEGRRLGVESVTPRMLIRHKAKTKKFLHAEWLRLQKEKQSPGSLEGSSHELPKELEEALSKQMTQELRSESPPQDPEHLSNVYVPNPNPDKPTGLKTVAIDGCNVGYGYGVTKFSMDGVFHCVRYFMERGHVVKCFLPRHMQKYALTQDQKNYFQQLLKERVIVLTPSRFIDGESATPYDDRFFLQYAYLTGGIIVSNDNFRDLLHQENSVYQEIIKKRVLPYTFIDDILMFAKDPYGPNGPKLEELLSHK